MAWWSVYWSIYFVSKIVISMFASSFVDGVMLLRQRYEVVNRKLEEISLVDGNPIDKGFTKHGLILVKPARNVPVLSTLDRIQTLHYDLCDLAKDINTIFSFQLLFYIASVFMAITIGLNNCFQGLMKRAKNDGDPLVMLYPLFTLYVLFYFGLQLTLISMVCAYTSSEANKTAVLVHKMLIDSTDSTVKADLELFSLQLLHRKVKFTACGFFPIDATLLYSIVGGVTTYLVILIQFQLAPGPEGADNKTLFNNTLGNKSIIELTTISP